MAIGIAIILSLAVIVLTCNVVSLKRRNSEVIQLNTSVQSENNRLEQVQRQLKIENDEEQKKLERFKVNIEAQENILASLRKTEEQLRKDAQDRADQAFLERVATNEAKCVAREKELEEEVKQKQSQVDAQYELYRLQSEEQRARLEEQIKQVQANLDDLRSKQRAYIEAQKRKQEEEEKEDFYRLTISDFDVSDIQGLRTLQTTFSRKDSIDKLIWESYIKSAYDQLMGRLNLPTGKKVCGIYKVTCLRTGAAYIGQSVDIRERFRQHIKSGLEHKTASNKLYQAMQKHGVQNFTFEVLEEVPRPQLNEREVFWIEFYGTKEAGLNKTVGGS